MGARVYDPQIGRFLSVDPLLDVFPSHSPYSYSFNNPISYSDPSGLAPEKEKGGGNKIQGFPFFEKSFEQYCIENEMAILKFDLLMTVARMNDVADKFIEEYTKKYSAGGGGDFAPTDRTGTNESENGTKKMTKEQKDRIMSNFQIDICDEVADKGEALANFWEAFWEANSEMTQEEFDYYTRDEKIVVNIMGDNDFKLRYKDGRIGSSLTLDWHIELFFPESIFRDNFDWNDKSHVYPIDPFNKPFYNNYNLTSVIQHELGHGFGAWKMGISEYNSIASFYKENWAISYVNKSYRNDFGVPLEQFKSDPFFGIFNWFYKGHNP